MRSFVLTVGIGTSVGTCTLGCGGSTELGGFPGLLGVAATSTVGWDSTGWEDVPETTCVPAGTGEAGLAAAISGVPGDGRALASPATVL